MMLTLLLCSLAVLVLGQDVEDFPPIPLLSADPGLVYNGTTSGVKPPVKLEAFLELNCGDSAAAWPVLKQVHQYYGADQLELVVHQFPLPYHRNGFLCTQGMALINNELPEQTFDYMEGILDNQIRFATGVTRNRTEFDVIESLANVATEVTTIDRELFVSQVNDYIGEIVRIWKYAARRGVAGTPWFAVNNVDLTINPSIRLTVEEWIAILDPLYEDIYSKVK